MKIDPHVHCRDEEQSYKATIASTLELAHRQGVDEIFDMPNTFRPVTIEDRVNERLKLVPAGEETNYYLYLGVTANPAQLREAVRCHQQYPQVIGLKMFVGRSVGNLAIVEYSEQRIVYQTLTDLSYDGVLAVHCEKENCLIPHLWNPNFPMSHSWVRPVAAEEQSVLEQIAFAEATNFPGTLHICHISLKNSVNLVKLARRRGKIRISCGVTPHHIIWNYHKMERRDGLRYKINPPLRSPNSTQALKEYLLAGDIDWIESDHAPHTNLEKIKPPYLSGYPSLTLYRNFVEEYLPRLGLTEEQIRALTHGNIIKVFSPKLQS